MATKYRQDLTAVDFRILKRFKHYLLSLGTEHSCGSIPEVIAPVIHLSTSEETVFVQHWHYSTSGWEEYARKKCLCFCYILKVRDFRSIVHSVACDIPRITEGLILHVLKKFSILLFDDRGNWKRQDQGGTEIWLEHRRLSPEGQIKKRNLQTAAAKKAKAHEHIRSVMNSRGMDFKTALKTLSPLGITPELLNELDEECKKIEPRKLKIREEVDKQIRKRPNNTICHTNR